MIIALHFTTIVGESISIECNRVDIEDPFGRTSSHFSGANVVSLSDARAKRKCKRCEGIGLIAVEVPLKTFADSFGIEARTCPYCDGKGIVKK